MPFMRHIVTGLITTGCSDLSIALAPANHYRVECAPLLSGNVLPLPLFPDWMQPFLEAQPFQGLVDVPFRIYCGDIAGSAILAELLQQASWVVVLTLLSPSLGFIFLGAAFIFFHFGIKKYTSTGS